jgi:hypothetical protein
LKTGPSKESTLDGLTNNVDNFELLIFSFYSNIKLDKEIIELFFKLVDIKNKEMISSFHLLYPNTTLKIRYKEFFKDIFFRS